MNFGVAREELSPDEFLEKTFAYMEYLGVPEMTIYYNPEHVAKSFAGVITKWYAIGFSYRITAIFLWYLTYEKVKEMTALEKKH